MALISGPTRAGRWLLAAALAGAALAAGTVHTVTLCAVSAVLASAAGLTWWNAERTDFRPRLVATLLLVTGVVLTGYTALQCVPMPIGWLAAIAPRNADVWSRALAPLHEEAPRWAPISLDPTATRIEVLKGIAYLLAFVTALRVARTRDGIGFLSAAIVTTGALLAVAALLHPAFGAHKLYGVWTPSTAVVANAKHLAPFLNPNNLAAYLNVSFCLAFAAMLSPQPRWPRPLVAAAAILFAATQILVASRGGVASMILAAILVVVVTSAHRSSKAQERAGAGRVSVLIAVTFIVGAIAIVLATSQQSSNELFDTNVAKFELLRQVVRMIPAYPLFGTGRGAFESTFPAFRDSPGLWTFSHPENVIAQWLIEWGTPVGLAGLAAIVFGLRPNTVLARSSTAAGAWAGLVAVAVQNLVDLGSETPGLVLAPVLCAALVVGGTAGRATRWRVERWGQSPRALAVTATVLAVVGIAAAAAGVGRELNDDRGALRDAAVARTAVGPMHTLARAAILRHPAEPYLPFIVGWRAAQIRDDDPIAWIEASLERSRVEAPAHLVLAHLLSVRSPSQARLEYRLAVEQSSQIDNAFGEGLLLVNGYYDALDLVSAGKAGLPMLRFIEDTLSARLPATCSRLDEDLAARAPDDPGPSLRAARGAIADLDAGESAPWCDGAARGGCVSRALEASARAATISPRSCEPYALRARARMAGRDPPATALSELAHAAESVADRVPCLKAVVQLADDAHDKKDADDALAKIATVGCADDAECSANLAWVAAAEEHRGEERRALVFYKRAYDRAPENDALLDAAARLAASSGLHGEAREDYERLARKHPEDVRWRKAADEQHDAALKGAATL